MNTKLMSSYSQFIHLGHYARWVETQGRRETWEETVDRYINYMCDKQCAGKISDEVKSELREGILNLEVMPSMRCMMTAGKALDSDQIAGYNCSFRAINDLSAFDEIMYLLMNGVGVGISVERQFIACLPTVSDRIHTSKTVIKVEDSRAGWASAYRELISMLYQGRIPEWDVSAVRPAGAKLKTFGGRASGPQPLIDLFKFTIDTFKTAVDRKLTSIECHDICCKIGEIVISGGVRRSALLSLSNPSDDRMRHAKSGNWFDLTPWRSMANNSCAYTEKPTMDVFFREWLALYESKSGERGIFNRQAAKEQMKKHGRRDSNHDFGLNPCVVGEALVSVADGRIHVPISVLAEEGKDVPVYCYDGKGEIVIRTMRNPRVTGYKSKILKVTMDDGSFVRVTPNHKIRLSSGEYIEARMIQVGDSLKTKTRYASSIKWICNDDKRHGNYWWICDGQRKNKAEHRIIAESLLGRKLKAGEVVHHKDRNGFNNTIENLEVMHRNEHNAIHRESMLGDNNPMRRAKTEWSEQEWETYRKKQSIANSGSNNGNFGGLSHEEVRNHALVLTRRLGRRFNNPEWMDYARDNGVPQRLSKWRLDEIGSFSKLSLWAAMECGIEYADARPDAVKTCQSLLSQGYDAFVRDDIVFIRRVCENCGEIFEVRGRCREISFCSQKCSSKNNWKTHKDKILMGMERSHVVKKDNLRIEQMKVFTGLKFKIGRTPEKKEWVEECQTSKISSEICRDSSPFRYWRDLKSQAVMFNHRVVSVVDDGIDTVYNGTVDEFHNFFTGGFESKTEDGNRKMVYINNMNCGEIFLRSKSCCNLTEVVIRSTDGVKDLIRKVRLATILGTMQATLTNFKYLGPEWKKNTEEEALLGVSLTGDMDNELTSGRLGKKELKDALDLMRLSTIKINKEFAKLLGINSAAAITTGKPSGTISQLCDCSSGIHARFAKWYIRRVRCDIKDPLALMMIEMGFPNEVDLWKPEHQMVFSFPVASPESSVVADSVSALEQLELWLIYRNHWCDHNQSCTVYIKEHEWMEVGAWVYKHFDEVAGIAFLPYSNQYKQAPYEEINKAEYDELLSKMPKKIDWSKLNKYETDDANVIHREVVCSGTSCELVDLVK